MSAAIAESTSPEIRIGEPRPQSPVAVLVFAKDPISRAGVASQLVGESGIEVVEPTPGRFADVAVVVAETIDDEVLRVVRTIRHGNRTRVVLVGGMLDSASTLAAVRAGIGGFLPRPMATRERLVRLIMDVRRGREIHPSAIGPVNDRPPQPDAPRLTPRELDVLRLLAEGSDTAEIAERLAYSEPTIKNVIQRLFERLNARNRPHAVAVALRSGII
jgi:DNA-binding NarL/FixJ family response regulator